MPQLIITFKKPNGQPLPYTQVRVTTSDIGQVDKTALLFGASPYTSDATGTATATVAANALPAGLYNIVASIAGYRSASVETTEAFTGPGVYTVTLEPLDAVGDPDNTYELSKVPAQFVSPMAPVSIELLCPDALAGKRQLVITSVSPVGFRGSEIENPVGLSNVANINVQGRLLLDTALVLVPDQTYAMPDYNFSDQAAISFKSITAQSPQGVDIAIDTLQVQYANIYPQGRANDLSEYTDTNGLAKWITPWPGEIPVWRGQYFDLMAWVQPGGEFSIEAKYYDRAKISLGTVVYAIPEGVVTGNVFRVRPLYNDDPNVATFELRILKDNQPVTEPATIKYL